LKKDSDFVFVHPEQGPSSHARFRPSPYRTCLSSFSAEDIVMLGATLIVGAVVTLIVVGCAVDDWRLKRTIAAQRARAAFERADEIVERVKELVAESGGMDILT
jgi:hypothetical protein